MKADAILNADMATLGRWLRQGLGWWIGELAALVPERWRQYGQSSRPVAIYQGDGQLLVFHHGQPIKFAPARGPRSLDMAVPASFCLMREVSVPAMSAGDLRGYAQIEAERLMPLPPRELLIDAMVVDRSVGGGRMKASVAAVPRNVSEDAIAVASATGIIPLRFGIVGNGQSGGMRFDFAPMLREEGRLPPQQRASAIWWGLVALAFALNVGLLVLRDQQSVERLAAIVDAQAPAVSVGRVMAQRIEHADSLSRNTAARRAEQDALGDLASVSAALPDAAWIQRYNWDGRSLRLAGYKQPAADVIAALRHAPRFANVRASNSDVVADIPIGRPFDITADMRRVSR